MSRSETETLESRLTTPGFAGGYLGRDTAGRLKRSHRLRGWGWAISGMGAALALAGTSWIGEEEVAIPVLSDLPEDQVSTSLHLSYSPKISLPWSMKGVNPTTPLTRKKITLEREESRMRKHRDVSKA